MSLILSRALAPPTVLMRSVRRLLEAKKNSVKMLFFWLYFLCEITTCFELPFEGMGHWIGLNITADHDLGFESCAINDSLTSFTFRSNYIMVEKNYGSMKKYYSKGVMVLLVLIENNYFLF